MHYLAIEKKEMYQKLKLKREIKIVEDALTATDQHKKRLLYQLTTLKLKLRGLGAKKTHLDSNN